MKKNEDVIVIGAGLIGLSCAFWLQKCGREVTILDKGGVCAGASYGNACTIATYGCLPIASPSIWHNLPTLLFGKNSPFSIKARHLPGLAPWLLRFMLESTSSRQLRNAAALASLQTHAMDSYVAIFDECAARNLIRKNGSLYFARTEKDLDAMGDDYRLRNELGIRQQMLDRDGVSEIEPALTDAACGGVFFPDAAHLVDPFELATRLADTVSRRGGDVMTAEVKSLYPHEGHVEVSTTTETIKAREVIVAAGAWSKPLAAQIGDKVPLDTERGYHVELPCVAPPISRPCCPVDLGFYMTPLDNRLRVAGLVEMGSIHDKADPRLFDHLQENAESLMRMSSGKSTHWLGFRPSLPDSLPVLGRSTHCPRVCYAFGHGHLGVSLASITGRIISEIVEGKGTTVDVAPFRVARF